ncbi:MAG: ATP-binding cassette domain-containing protein [Pseudomonadota bacterium]|nr:ATP-binding cassette domain-containing protein [Pseudomonadota bacterium]
MGEIVPPITQEYLSEEGAPLLPLRVDRLVYAVQGKRLLGEISTTIRSSATFVVGPNGAGKSLFLRLVHGLLLPTGGSIEWGALTPRTARCRQAMVFQKPVLLRRSVRANVDYALAVKGWRGAGRRECVEKVLNATGLWELRDRAARVLSGGEQQRLVLARAWVFGPCVLLLDEPTAHLDPSATRQVEQIVSRIKADGTTIIMTTHDLGQVKRLAEEVLFFHQGKLLEQETAEKFLDNPGTPEGSAFIEGELLW